jgi:hypothetical protein
MTISSSPKIDPHHCRCFSISKSDFQTFANKLRNYGFTQPLLEEDHHQILGLTKRLSEYYQIHVKLMRTGRIEAEIEYPQDYPMAHINPIHSYSAHAELNVLFSVLQISCKCKHKPPITCIQRQIVPAHQPTHKDTFLAIGGAAALVDIIFNDGKITSAVLKTVAKTLSKKKKPRKSRPKKTRKSKSKKRLRFF